LSLSHKPQPARLCVGNDALDGGKVQGFLDELCGWQRTTCRITLPDQLRNASSRANDLQKVSFPWIQAGHELGKSRVFTKISLIKIRLKRLLEKG
jgi:hypothetical protein